MVSNVLEADIEAVLETALAGAGDALFIVDPSATAIRAIVEADIVREEDPSISILADEGVLTDVFDEFLIASTAADLVADGRLAIRILPTDVENALFVSDSGVVALVNAGDRVAALTTDDAEFVSAIYETYRDTFDDARPYQLRTPALSHVRETMAAEIGEQTRDDFVRMLTAVADDEDSDGRVDEVTAALLVAAKNDVLLYDISKWGEDIGIASKATFSRTKTRLEDVGLIDTEKVPIDVGRPRLRLKLGEKHHSGDDTDAIVETVARVGS